MSTGWQAVAMLRDLSDFTVKIGVDGEDESRAGRKACQPWLRSDSAEIIWRIAR
jgi:hypothetical protein